MDFASGEDLQCKGEESKKTPKVLSYGSKRIQFPICRREKKCRRSWLGDDVRRLGLDIALTVSVRQGWVIEQILRTQIIGLLDLQGRKVMKCNNSKDGHRRQRLLSQPRPPSARPGHTSVKSHQYGHGIPWNQVLADHIPAVHKGVFLLGSQPQWQNFSRVSPRCKSSVTPLPTNNADKLVLTPRSYSSHGWKATLLVSMSHTLGTVLCRYFSKTA